MVYSIAYTWAKKEVPEVPCPAIWMALDFRAAWWLIVPVVAAAVLGCVWSLRPLRAQFRRWREFRRRALLEDVLKHIFTLREEGREAGPDSVAGYLGWRKHKLLPTLTQMEAAGLLRCNAGRFTLTPEGENLALQVVRAHRLWETYLADEAGVAVVKVHGRAERHEHRLVADQRVDELDALLGHPRTDPHGDPIPAVSGEMPVLEVQPLTTWPIGELAAIVHVEDEPEPLLREIASHGLKPGTVVRVVERSAAQLLISDGKQQYPLSALAASNVQVRAAKEPGLRPAALLRLSELEPGDQAVIVALDDDLRGFTRRRLLDLGLTRNAHISAELANAFGDPLGFRIRGTMVALRREQASKVWVRRMSEPSPRACGGRRSLI
ncbi:MAG: FeoA domain-containing protein [Terriglobales bacterium]